MGGRGAGRIGRWWGWGAIALVTSFLVVLLGWLGPKALTQSVPFNDIQGHWAQPCIESLALRNILNGYPDGSFRPERSVTRAEFATLVDAAFFETPSTRPPVQFVDVAPGFWASPAIQAAYRTQFLSGYPGNIFRPQQPIPRVQVLVSLVSGLQRSAPPSNSGVLATAFDDAAAVPAYAQDNIATAATQGWVVNYPNVRLLRPNQSASRAEVATFLCQALAEPDDRSLVPSQYVATAAPGDNSPDNSAELRGVWLTNIDSDVLFSRDRLSAGIQRLADLNFNTIYPTVWNWGYTLYPSAVAEAATGRSLDPQPGLQNRDMLAEAIELGHQQNLAVIPWFEFGLMAPADSDLARRHPDWLTQKSDGNSIVLEGQDPRVWLNPFHPEVQQFLTDLIVEVVRNYDVDGIQLDDHFGLPVELGYDALTVQRYRQEHRGQAPPLNPENSAWMAWRSQQLTQLLAQIFQAVKAQDPDCLISVSPNPYPFAYDRFLQNWPDWDQRGLVEELVVQVYRSDLDAFKAELSHPAIQSARRHIPVGIGILAGLKNRPVPMARIQEQIDTTRDFNFAGVSFFFYETLWTSATETQQNRIAALRSTFTTPRPRS